MSVTIELSDAVAEQLRSRAAISGEDISTFADAWLADTLATDEAEAIEGIRNGLEDADAGRERPIAESLADMLDLIDKRTQAKASAAKLPKAA